MRIFLRPFLKIPDYSARRGDRKRKREEFDEKKKKEKDACSSIGSEYFGMSEEEEVDGRKGGWIPEEKSGAIRKLI